MKESRDGLALPRGAPLNKQASHKHFANVMSLDQVTLRQKSGLFHVRYRKTSVVVQT